MYKLKCPCLNITIHAQKGGEREAEGKTFLSKANASPFFADNVLEINLAVGGITKEVPTLVHTSHAEDWDIYRCINCSTDVYALHSVKGYNRVLISNNLQSDPDTIKELSASSDFSPAFKIILKTDKQEQQNREGNAVLINRDQLSQSMNYVQDLIKKYLNAEESAMEKRIQEYNAQQKKMFASLKARAFQDKTAICRVLSVVDACQMESSIHEAMDETTDTFANNLDFKSLHLPEHHQRLSHNKLQGHIKKDTSRPTMSFTVGSPQQGNRSPVIQKKRTHTHKINVRNAPSTADADPMFALDGFTDDCEPFFESEEDDLSSSDNSFQMEESAAVPRHVSALKKSVYSSSVPISLPMGTKTSHSWEDDDNDNMEIPEPSKIGESMKALARSVQYNTEQMFGELPRPRLFTEPRSAYR